MEKLYYKISEVASLLGENASTIRFWSNTFEKFLSPKRSSQGSRMYVASEIDTLRRIQYLTREGGLSLEAVARKLSEGGEEVSATMEVRRRLLSIRGRLEHILSELS